MTKKILIISDNLPDQINGVVTTYKNIESHAVADGYDIFYIDPRSYYHFDCPFYKEIKITIATPAKVGKEIEKIRPDYIHISTEGPLGICARNYLSMVGYNYTSAYHTKFPEAVEKMLRIPEYITWKFVKWFHSKSSTVLTTTDSMVSQLRSKGFKDNVKSWTRGTNKDFYFPFYPRAVNNTKILLNVGRVSKEKNLEDFYNLDIPNSRKIQVGDGPMLEVYKKKYPDVEFVGSKTGKELAKFYQLADVFVFPSKWDTFGIVMIESMACGTPVAAYPVQGPEDVIDQSITGVMNPSLEIAVQRALGLNRHSVHTQSLKWTWKEAWLIFHSNLVPINTA